MELWLTLRFRGSPLGLRDRFPSELAFIGRQLRSLDGPEVPPNERVCTAHVQVSPEQAEAILSWGRMRTVDGRTLLASVTFDERWHPQELGPSAVVELVRAPAVDSPVVLAAVGHTWRGGRARTVTGFAGNRWAHSSWCGTSRPRSSCFTAPGPSCS